jgi:cytoskeletal protein RodZ
MADRIREKETVVVEEEGPVAEDRGTNPLGVIILIIVALLLLALFFGWFKGGDDTTETDNTASVEQETQVEIPNGTGTDGGTQQ